MHEALDETTEPHPDLRLRLLAAMACVQSLVSCNEGLTACVEGWTVASTAVVLAAQLDARDPERSRLATEMLRAITRGGDKGYTQVVDALLEDGAPGVDTSMGTQFVDAPEHLYFGLQRLLAFLDLFQVCVGLL